MSLTAALQTTAPFQLRRIPFVPARNSDAVPVPEGLDLVVLNSGQPLNVRACAAPLGAFWDPFGTVSGPAALMRVDQTGVVTVCEHSNARRTVPARDDSRRNCCK